MTITIGNTIFGALDGGRPVDWRIVFWDLAQLLGAGVEKSKATPICPFFFYLYNSQGLLTQDEDMDYKTAKEFADYWITLKLDSRPESKDEKQANNPLGRSRCLLQPGIRGESRPTGHPTHSVKRRRKLASTGTLPPTGSLASTGTPTEAAATGPVGRIGRRAMAVGSAAVRGCGEEHAPGKYAVFGDGGQAVRDWKGVGHGAAQVPGADRKASKGAGDGRPPGPDRLPPKGEHRVENSGSYPGGETERGGGFDSGNVRREAAHARRLGEGGHHGPEIPRLPEVSG